LKNRRRKAGYARNEGEQKVPVAVAAIILRQGAFRRNGRKSSGIFRKKFDFFLKIPYL